MIMATRGVSCSYQEVIDLSTEPDHVTVVGIHTPTGDTPRKLFRGFFDQYKKYKYLGASVSLVPAARLPADLLQVSYQSGDYIDPRDAMNPLMFHGCHGDDMGVILNRLYGDGDSISDSLDGIDASYVNPTSAQTALSNLDYDALERLYYKALTDNTWKKAHPQRGFRKSGLRPLIYTMATNRQLMPGSRADALLGIEMANNTGNNPREMVAFNQNIGDPAGVDFDISDNKYNFESLVKQNTQFFTPRLTGLGWMDTRNVMTDTTVSTKDAANLAGLAPEDYYEVIQNQINYAELPKLYMGVILMSASYKVRNYYRMIINHRFAFKDFRGISFMPECNGVPSYFNANPSVDDADQGLFNPETFEDYDVPNETGSGSDPEPGIQNVSVTVKVRNRGAIDPNSVDVLYNYENNSDPYTATYGNANTAWHTFSAYTVPVGGKIKVQFTNGNPSAVGTYTVTDAADSVEVAFDYYTSWTVTDNLTRGYSAFLESGNDADDELKH